jgi:hypothetical protein
MFEREHLLSKSQRVSLAGISILGFESAQYTSIRYLFIPQFCLPQRLCPASATFSTNSRNMGWLMAVIPPTCGVTMSQARKCPKM